MAHHIITYKEHKNNDGNLMRPYFVKDARHFEKDGKWIGISEDTKTIYLPGTVERMTNEQLIDWVKSLDNMWNREEERLMTEEEKESYAIEWLKQKGFITE
jgi:hypothetical protein